MERKLFFSLIAAMFFALLVMSASPGLAECPQGAVDINTATVEELQEIKGIGSVLASRIVAYRQEQPFASKKEITAVKGIGAKTYQEIAELICTE